MDKDILACFIPENTLALQQGSIFLDRLKEEKDGWKKSILAISNVETTDNSLKYICLQVIEHFIKTRYSTSDLNDQQFLKEFLSNWIRQQVSNPDENFNKNKEAQIMAYIFTIDFPVRWPTFFMDLIETFNLGEQAVDHFLRVLKAIHIEIADREIKRSQELEEKYTKIKDFIRTHAVRLLADTWLKILQNYRFALPKITNLCLNTISLYISWIDINLIANEHFIPELFLLIKEPNTREPALECLYAIVNKGMPAKEKMSLIKELIPLLQANNLTEPLPDDESDYSVKLSRFINLMGCQSIEMYKSSRDMFQEDGIIALASLDLLIPIAMNFLKCEYDDVSQSCFDFCRGYLQICKILISKNQFTPNHQTKLKHILEILVQKMKYDESYDFENEDESEATFQDYRRQLKHLFENISTVNRKLVLDYVLQEFIKVSNSWSTAYYLDIELILWLFYQLGEAIRMALGNHFDKDTNEEISRPMNEMMKVLLCSGIGLHPQYIITLQYFEVLSRYEKFFIVHPGYLPTLIKSYMENGLKHPNCKVRSRVSYLFSKMVKHLKGYLSDYSSEMLVALKEFMVLAPVNENGQQAGGWLSTDDQLYIYEAAGILIIASKETPEAKANCFNNFIVPVLEQTKFHASQIILSTNIDIINKHVEIVCHAMDVINRLSKIFSNNNSNHTTQIGNCNDIFIEASRVFLQVLSSCSDKKPEVDVDPLKISYRLFLNRTIICMSSDMYPEYLFAPTNYFLKDLHLNEIIQFLPLLHQMINKYGQMLVPLLNTIFLPVINVIFTSLSLPFDQNDVELRREQLQLQRLYFQLIHYSVSKVFDFIRNLPSEVLEFIVNNVASTASESTDINSQKLCYSIIKKLVVECAGPNSPPDFNPLLFDKMIRSCILGLFRFDFKDPQSSQILNECALCIKSASESLGESFRIYLRQEILSKFHLSVDEIDAFIIALNNENKVFRNYLKVFVTRIKNSNNS